MKNFKKVMLFSGLALCVQSGLAFAGTKTEQDEACTKDTYTNQCDSEGIGWFCSTSKAAGATEGATAVWKLVCAEGETCVDVQGSIDCRAGDQCVSAESYCEENNPLLGHRCKDGAFIDWTCKAGTKCQAGIKDGVETPGWLSCIDDGSGSGETTGDCTSADSYCDADNPLLGHRCKDGAFIDWTCKTGQKCQAGIKDGVETPGWLSCIDDGSGSGETTGDCTSADSYCDANNPLLGHRCKDGAFIDWTCKAGQKCQAGIKDGVASPGWLSCVTDDGSGTTPGGNNNNNNSNNNTQLPSGGSANSDSDDDSGCSATGTGALLSWLGLALIPALRRRG